MKNNSECELEKSFSEFCKTWLRLKKEAVKTEDYSFYLDFLRIVQKGFTKLYATLEKPGTLKLVGTILKTAAFEIRKSMIKYNKSKLPF